MAIPRVICCALLATGLLASSAFAQNDSKPVNLTLPPNSFPMASPPLDTPASTTPASPAPASANPANKAKAATESCDGTTDNRAQVHGSVETGVVAGNHFSGNYQAGNVNITKPFGDCNHPSTTLRISVSAGQGHFGYNQGSH